MNLTMPAAAGSISEFEWRTFTPFQRALLVNDGTVTKLIEAYTLEAVEVVRLKQETQLLSSAHTWLKTPPDTEVIAREVVLRARHSSTVYAYAVSLLVPARLPAGLLNDLASEPGGLGQVLLNSRIENRREILWCGREQVTDPPEAIRELTGVDFISRTYRIIAGGQPVMLIDEKFPANGMRVASRESPFQPYRGGTV
ncbi:MAG: chorismate--pyruvate lyase family protein [Methylococcales bacterium]